MSFMQRQKNFWNEMIWKPKKLLSLDQLKYHHATLERNPVVTDSNKKLLVETFRSIAEILIWGDQNDSCVFDFFLEKNMQSYFLKILSKRPGRYVVLQLLQTMSILFENIKNETSIYYLLSNNHVNSLIVLKLDFSDEEVLAYYISFLKTLSFKLNKHTIHFFYNEHLRDFPLYTEAIKFFNNPESMVRIAVRTLTLNVYKVEDKNTVEFICNKTATPYFSNLVWFIGNHVLQLDECLEQKSSHLKLNSLESAVAEHLDHLHYINDILSLNVLPLNDILKDHLLNRLFVPLYVYSLFETTVEARKEEDTPRVSSKIALFLLSQVFLIVSHFLLTTELAYLVLTGDQDLILPPVILSEFNPSAESPSKQKHRRNSSRGSIRGFIAPEASLAASLSRPSRINASPKPVLKDPRLEIGGEMGGSGESSSKAGSSQDSHSNRELGSIPEYNGFVVIESPSDLEIAEALARQQAEQERLRELTEETLSDNDQDESIPVTPLHSIPVRSNAFVESILSAIIPGPSDDSRCLFAIAIFYAMITNDTVSDRLLEAFSLKDQKNQREPYYLFTELIGRLLSVIEASAVGSVRLVTLHLCITLLSHLLHLDFTYTASSNSSPHSDNDPTPASHLSDHHLKKLKRAQEEACRKMETFYRSLGEGEEVFLELFEDEYSNEQKFYLKVNYLLMEASMLLPATDTPLTGIDFSKRLPCGETEKARKAMRVFFAIRKFSQCIYNEKETHLPLTQSTTSVVTEDIIDTTNSDLVRCTIISGESSMERFLVVTENEFILVEPDKDQLGCGIVKFIAFLQDVEISQDPADNVSVRIVAYHRLRAQLKRRPALVAKITFEDNIRCLATRQNLQRKRDALRHKKMSIIAEMLGIPPLSSPIRKREVIPPSVHLTDTSDPVTAEPRTVINQQPMGHSPHKYATTVLKNNTSESTIPRPLELYELGLVDSNGIPVSTRAPSPHAHYVPAENKVILSMGNDPFESNVTILPPKRSVKETVAGNAVRNNFTDSARDGSYVLNNRGRENHGIEPMEMLNSMNMSLELNNEENAREKRNPVFEQNHEQLHEGETVVTPILGLNPLGQCETSGHSIEQYQNDDHDDRSVGHSDDDIQHDDDAAVCHSDDNGRHGDEDDCHSDDVQHDDDAAVCHNDDYDRHSDDNGRHGDDDDLHDDRYDGIHGDYDDRQSDDDDHHGDDGRHGDNGRHSDYDDRQSDDDDRQSDDDGRHGDDDGRHGDDDGRHGDDNDLHGDHDDRYDGIHGDYDDRQSDDDGRHGDDAVPTLPGINDKVSISHNTSPTGSLEPTSSLNTSDDVVTQDDDDSFQLNRNDISKLHFNEMEIGVQGDTTPLDKSPTSATVTSSPLLQADSDPLTLP